MKTAYVGIDLAFAKKKRLPVSVGVRENGALRPLMLKVRGLPKPPSGKGNVAALDAEPVAAFAAATLEYLRKLEQTLEVRFHAIAIDCPRCPKAEGSLRRAAESALDANGISCITTPSRSEFGDIRLKAKAHLSVGGAVNRLPHANQLWMLVGFELFSTLEKKYRCLEVYPHAIAARLGCAPWPKSSKPGRRARLEAAAKVTAHSPTELDRILPKSAWGSGHDRLDALLSCWIASLPQEDLDAYGDPPQDVIWVPRC